MCERVCASEKVKEGIPRGNSKTKKELKKLDADRRYLVCVHTVDMHTFGQIHTLKQQTTEHNK